MTNDNTYTDASAAGSTDAPAAHIAVSLSGGGHRASLFGLGALLYLVDAGKGPEIGNVTSISGGSLTNGYVGLHSDLTRQREPAGRTFWADVKPLAEATSTRGTIWAWPWTYVYLAVLAALLGVAVLSSFVLDPLPSLGVWVIAVLLVAVLGRQRSRIARASFDATVFHGRKLGDMHTGVDHIIAAADLQTAEQAYFSSRFLYSYRLGWGTPSDLSVAWAAQASACLPGAFAPVALDATAFAFDDPRPEAPDRFLLVDGGVYDNMGTEWSINVRKRITRTGVPSPPPVVPDELIVVNASAAAGVAARRSVTWPLVGEITSLLADKDVMYDQTTAVRRRLLYQQFTASRRTESGGGLTGVLAQIDRTPTALATSFAPGDDEAAERARTVLEQLPDVDWEAEAEANSAVKTALSKIDPDRAARLLRHAYALTMADAVVLLDYPLIDVPELATFHALVERS